MKKQTVIRDERILAQNRKIGSDTCYLLMFILFASILIQQYLFNAPFTQYAVEIIAFLGASIYILIRTLLLGNNMFEADKNTKKIVAVTSVVCGVIVTVINGVLNYARYMEHYHDNRGFFIATLAITFASAAAVSFILFFIAYLLGEKRRKQIEKKLNEDDIE